MKKRASNQPSSFVHYVWAHDEKHAYFIRSWLNAVVMLFLSGKKVHEWNGERKRREGAIISWIILER